MKMTNFYDFRDTEKGQRSYLIACPMSRQALIIHPSENSVGDYARVLQDRGLELAFTLETHRQLRSFPKLESFRASAGAVRIMPAGPDSWDTSIPGNRDELVQPGGKVSLGKLRIAVIEPPAGFKGDLAYRLGDYTFTLESLLIAYPGDATSERQSVEFPMREIGSMRTPNAGPPPVINYRRDRDAIDIHDLLLEDLHSSLIENRFSPKETRLVRTYLEVLETSPSPPPAAADLSRRMENMDSGAIHVVVHGIRWKQIKRSRLPLILAGQASKWLKAYSTEPEFTSHEEEFLQAYLELVSRNGTPPCGPEIQAELGSQRCIQWVRKRAFTIRRKQQEFGLPMLILSRKRCEPDLQRGVSLTRDEATPAQRIAGGPIEPA